MFISIILSSNYFTQFFIITNSTSIVHFEVIFLFKPSHNLIDMTFLQYYHINLFKYYIF
nr:MAG TPA: hypothetical protein [Inoviridae sp.]